MIDEYTISRLEQEGIGDAWRREREEATRRRVGDRDTVQTRVLRALNLKREVMFSV